MGSTSTIGEQIVTVACDKDTRQTPGEYLIGPKYMSGEFEEVHPDRRDSMLSFPCYRTSISIPGGASGGPVFDSCGRIFGINCTGYDGTDLSYLTRVNEALPLTAAGMMFGPDDPPTDRSLLQLAETGYVVFIPPFPTGLSRHWGDDSMSDTIGQYVAGWRIADAVGFGADWNRDRWSIVDRVA